MRHARTVSDAGKPRAAGYIQGQHGYLTQAEFEHHRDLGTPGLVWIDDGSYRVGHCEPDDAEQDDLAAGDGFDEPRGRDIWGPERDEDSGREFDTRLDEGRIGGGL